MSDECVAIQQASKQAQKCVTDCERASECREYTQLPAAGSRPGEKYDPMRGQELCNPPAQTAARGDPGIIIMHTGGRILGHQSASLPICRRSDNHHALGTSTAVSRHLLRNQGYIGGTPRALRSASEATNAQYKHTSPSASNQFRILVPRRHGEVRAVKHPLSTNRSVLAGSSCYFSAKASRIC
jgi:hypothetical protein